jgi:hypothetical protein
MIFPVFLAGNHGTGDFVKVCMLQAAQKPCLRVFVAGLSV